MAHRHDRLHMDHQDILAWGSTAASTTPTAGEEDVVADVDEPPDHNIQFQQKPDFHRSTIRLQTDRNESLLTRALTDHTKSDAGVTHSIDLSRRRSVLSNTSAASTVDLTSDGGITSPARTNTPSPPPPSNYINLAPYTFGSKPSEDSVSTIVGMDSKDLPVAQHSTKTASSKPTPSVEALVKKRCITFACGTQKVETSVPEPSKAVKADGETTKPVRKCMIKFACTDLKPGNKPYPVRETAVLEITKSVTQSKPSDAYRRRHSRSPSVTRKSRPTPPAQTKYPRESYSPIAVKNRKPKYIAANEESLLSSEAIRFHEFASDEPQEDDWIRKDVSETRTKLTIDDTLKKENAIRRLGKEAEEEALQDEEDNEEDDNVGADSDENDYEEDEDEDYNEDLDDHDEDDNTVEGSDDNASDGNETDNEAGFADSDDESDPAGDYQFWTPGRSIFPGNEATMIRPSGHRAASESSIDSLKHMSPFAQALAESRGRKPKSRRIKIRPGTPDLPDSTDFVCGTLDEDRPLEDAYVSCMEARKRQKHFLIPQDIDPSFPTSDPEDAEEDEANEVNNDSDEHVWLHGQFEDSDDEAPKRRRKSIRSPGQSPKRLHSPPPPKRLHSPPPPKRFHSPPPVKNRHRSPPPRRLFGGHSPKRFQSPPPPRHTTSPPASPTSHATSGAITFAPLGQRPGLTHTKSLPRTPNVFGKQYREARLASLSRGTESSDAVDGHTRGAIDIVKGLEQKRQRRKEKFYQKLCNRARKVGQPERRPLSGKGAERMRELGLQMAGKIENRTGKAEFVLSV